MRDNKELNENDTHCIPSYCFNWNDGDAMDAPHKQSGDIDNPNNFENHKKASKDIAPSSKLLEVYTEQQMREIYADYYLYLEENQGNFDADLLLKYCPNNF